MVRASKLMIAGALVLGAGGPLNGRDGVRGSEEVQGRFENQQDRIEQGYDNGSLTRGEACPARGPGASPAPRGPAHGAGTASSIASAPG